MSGTVGSKRHSVTAEGIGYIFLVLCLYLLVFEELGAKYHFNPAAFFRNLIPLLAVVLLVIRISDNTGYARKLLHPAFLAGAVFTICGFIGWFVHHYQTFYVTAVTMFEHLRFWVCLWFFIEFGKVFPLARFARRLFCHTAIIGALVAILSTADAIFEIWPRQIYRYGYGSVQLFFGHPSYLGAHAVFLIGMLCLLMPYLPSRKKKKGWMRTVGTILTFWLLLVVLMTLRVRLIGFAVFFALLYIWMIVLGKKLLFPAAAAAGLGALAVGWKRLVNYYFSPYAATVARGQFAINSVDIAKKNAPFGSGFGTFGSRLTQWHYSPLYYQYDMMLTLGVSPEHPNFICDSFFPVIIAESGWLGTAAYALLIFYTLYLIFRFQRKAPRGKDTLYPVFTALCMLGYEILEATGTLAFSETYSAAIALVLGFCLACSSSESPAYSNQTELPS